MASLVDVLEAPASAPAAPVCRRLPVLRRCLICGGPSGGFAECAGCFTAEDQRMARLEDQ